MTANTDLESILGKMEDNMKVTGSTESSTEKEHTDKQQDKRDVDAGLKARGWSGSMKSKLMHKE